MSKKRKYSKRDWPIPDFFALGGFTEDTSSLNAPKMRLGNSREVINRDQQKMMQFLAGVTPFGAGKIMESVLPEAYTTAVSPDEKAQLQGLGSAVQGTIMSIASTVGGTVGGGAGNIPGVIPGQNQQDFSDNNVPKAMGGRISMSKKEFVDEHNRLLKTLKSPSHKDDLNEYNLQSKEMKKYLGKGGYYQTGGDFTDITGGFNHQDINPLNTNQGVPVNDNTVVEQGETIFNPENYVFSDRIKVPGTKLTFAQKSKQINRRYKLRPDDTLANESKNLELTRLMEEQETIKREKADKYLQKAIELNPDIAQDIQLGEQMEGQMGMQEPQEMMASGGKIYIKPSKRGSLHTYLGVPQDEKIPASKLQIKESDSSAIKKKKQFALNARKWNANGGPINPPGSNKRFMDLVETDVYGPQFELNPDPLSYTSYYDNPDLNTFSLDPEQPTDEPLTDPKVKKSKRWLGAIPGALGSLAAPIANLATAASLKDARLTPEVNLERINATPAISLAQKEGETALATGLKNIKENTMNPGSYLTNATMMSGNVADQLSQNIAAIKYQEELGNIDASNREMLINREIQKYNNLIQDQDAAQRAFMYQTAAKQFGDVLQGAGVNAQQFGMEDKMLDWLGTDDFGMRGVSMDKNGNLVFETRPSYRHKVDQLKDGRYYKIGSDNNVIFTDKDGNPLKS